MTPASVKARVTRATCSTVTPFCISASSRLEATSRPPVTAMQPARAIRSQSVGVKVFSKRMFPHQVIATPALEQPLGERAQHRGRRRLVDEVEAGLPGLGHQLLHAIDDQIGGGGLVAADVGERDVAEGALLPVAAVRQRQLVPAPVRPETVHRVQHLEQRDVAIERQAVVGRRPGLGVRNVARRGVGLEDHAAVLAHEGSMQRRWRGRPGDLELPEVPEQAQERALAVVERHVVEAVEHPGLSELAQLGVDVAAAEDQARRGPRALDRAGEPERAVDVAGERRADPDDVGPVARAELRADRVGDLVDQRGGPCERRRERIEAGGAGGQLLGVARQLEARIDPVADRVGDVVDIQAGEVLGPIGDRQLAVRRGERGPPHPPRRARGRAARSAALRAGTSGERCASPARDRALAETARRHRRSRGSDRRSRQATPPAAMPRLGKAASTRESPSRL